MLVVKKARMLWTPKRYRWEMKPLLDPRDPNLASRSLRKRTAAKAPQSRNPLQYGGASSGEFSLDDLQKSRDLAEELMVQIARLRGTRFVKDLVAEGDIQEDDLLHPGLTFGPLFRGLTLLPNWAQSVAKQLDYRSDQVLKEICQYVRDQTKTWNDELVSGWLRDTKKPHVENPTALKQWRHEHGLIG